jgi:hypothetical protein
MTKINEIKPVAERDPITLGEIRLIRWVVQHGDSFQIVGKGSSLRTVSKGRVMDRVDDPHWKIVYVSFSPVEFPSKDGRMNYFIEIENDSNESGPERYSFQAPDNRAMEASLKAHRANERLKKKNLSQQPTTTSNGQ